MQHTSPYPIRMILILDGCVTDLMECGGTRSAFRSWYRELRSAANKSHHPDRKIIIERNPHWQVC